MQRSDLVMGLVIVLLAGCGGQSTATPLPTPDLQATVAPMAANQMAGQLTPTTAPIPSSPTAAAQPSPTATPDVQATIAAGVEATLQARPTPTHIVIAVTATATLTPTPAATPVPVAQRRVLSPKPFTRYVNTGFGYSLEKAPKWAQGESDGAIVSFPSPNGTYGVWVIVERRVIEADGPDEYVAAIGFVRAHPELTQTGALRTSGIYIRPLDSEYVALMYSYEYAREGSPWRGIMALYVGPGEYVYWVYVETPLHGWNYGIARDIIGSLRVALN